MISVRAFLQYKTKNIILLVIMLDSTKIIYDAIHSGTEETELIFYKTISESDSYFSLFKASSTLLILDTNIEKLDFFKNFTFDSSIPCCVIPAGEEHKTIENVLLIIKTALKANLQRDCTFIGIGGGVISDMTAFAASIYKRGVRCEFIPTTLLSMVDACIGGKTGCDFEEYKNIIGTFHPASKLHYFTDTLLTLPQEEYKSGLAEVLKTAMLFAPKLFDIMKTNHDQILNKDNELILQIIKRCSQAKAHIVEKDLTEKGNRMLLNLGHTFGHALEKTIGLGKITHGAAVAWGIGRAIDLSVQKGFCENEYKQEVFEILDSYDWCKEPIHPLAINIENLTDKLIDAMRNDKKNCSNGIRFILQRELNSNLIEFVAEDEIRKVLTKF